MGVITWVSFPTQKCNGSISTNAKLFSGTEEQQLRDTRFFGSPETVDDGNYPFGALDEDEEREYGNSLPRATFGGNRAFISHQGSLQILKSINFKLCNQRSNSKFFPGMMMGLGKRGGARGLISHQGDFFPVGIQEFFHPR